LASCLSSFKALSFARLWASLTARSGALPFMGWVWEPACCAIGQDEQQAGFYFAFSSILRNHRLKKIASQRFLL